MRPIVEEEPEPAFTLLAKIEPEAADLSFASAKKFLDLATKFDLTVKVDASLVVVADTVFARSHKTKAGELKKAGGNEECLFVTLLADDFAATIFWRNRVLQHGFVGGPKSGHRPEKLFGKSEQTKMIEEITQCFSND